jgi:hypothetical protein
MGGSPPIYLIQGDNFMARGEEFKPYMVFQKDGQGSLNIYTIEEARQYIADGWEVRITKANWDLSKKVKKTKKKSKTKK